MIEHSFFRHDGLVNSKDLDFSTKEKGFGEEEKEKEKESKKREEDEITLPKFDPNTNLNIPSLSQSQIENPKTDDEKISELKCTTILKPYELPLYFSFILPYFYNSEKIFIFILILLFTIFLLNLLIFRFLHQPNIVDVLLMGKFIFVGNILVYTLFMKLSEELSYEQKMFIRVINSVFINFGFVSTSSTYNVYHKLSMVKSIRIIQKNKIIGIIFETVSMFCLNFAFSTFVLFSRRGQFIPGFGFYAGVAFLYLLDILYIMFTTFSGAMIKDIKMKTGNVVPHLIFKMFFMLLIGFIYFFFKGDLLQYGTLSLILLYVGFGFGTINIIWLFIYYYQLNK